jgi:predicted ester cyclase
MTNSESIAKQFFQAFNDHDPEKERQLLHPQFSYTVSDGTRIEGVQETIDIDTMYLNAFPDMRMETKNIVSSGDVVVTEFLVHGTQRGRYMDIEPTNRMVSFLLCNVLEVRDNKVFSVREYFDSVTLMRQLGVQPKQEPAHS